MATDGTVVQYSTRCLDPESDGPWQGTAFSFKFDSEVQTLARLARNTAQEALAPSPGANTVRVGKLKAHGASPLHLWKYGPQRIECCDCHWHQLKMPGVSSATGKLTVPVAGRLYGAPYRGSASDSGVSLRLRCADSLHEVYSLRYSIVVTDTGRTGLY
jgi:hypothetical protein